jgi:site-specific recombinase XerD
MRVILGLWDNDQLLAVDLESGAAALLDQLVRSLEESQTGLRPKEPKTRAGRRTIVCHPDGHAICPSTAGVSMEQAMDRTGMDGVTRQGLRHSFASLALHNDANLKTLQTVLGHANINVTLGRYGHMLGGAEEHVAARLNAAMERVVVL